MILTPGNVPIGEIFSDYHAVKKQIYEGEIERDQNGKVIWKAIYQTKWRESKKAYRKKKYEWIIQNCSLDLWRSDMVDWLNGHVNKLEQKDAEKRKFYRRTNSGTKVFLLQLATALGETTIVDQLIALGANITVVDQYGWLPLHYAAEQGHVDLIERLRTPEIINSPENNGNTPILMAAIRGHLQVVKKLCQLRADVTQTTTDGYSLLHCATVSTNSGLIRYLVVKKGFDVNENENDDGETCLTLAADAETGISSVDNRIRDQLLTTLLSLDTIEVDKPEGTHNTTALMKVSKVGDTQSVRLLVDEGANVNAIDNDGHNPLHYAVSTLQVDTVKLLLYLGADPTVTNNKGYMPLALLDLPDSNYDQDCEEFEEMKSILTAAAAKTQNA